MNFRKSFLIAFCVALVVAAAFADGSIPKRRAPGVVAGVVTTVSGNMITILNGTVAIDATNAKIMTRNGAATIADVKPGMPIIAVLSSGDGVQPFPAVHIALLDPPDGDLTGPVQSIDVAGSKITVLGQTIAVTSTTKFDGGPEGAPVRGLGDIKVNDYVSVVVDLVNSTLTARSIHLFPPRPVVIAGKVKSIASDSWVITDKDGKDVKVLINEQTRISGSPAVGDPVKIAAIVDQAGNLVALTIVKLEPTPPSPVAFDGVVKSIEGPIWTIDDKKVGVTAKTTIIGNPKAGDTVHVVGVSTAKGIIASSIEKK